MIYTTVTSLLEKKGGRDLEPFIKLWMAVLLEGVISAMWTKHQLERKDGIYEVWTYNPFDRAWVMTDNYLFNGFRFLCDLLEVKAGAFRRKVALLPSGWFKGERKVREKGGADGGRIERLDAHHGEDPGHPVGSDESVDRELQCVP